MKQLQHFQFVCHLCLPRAMDSTSPLFLIECKIKDSLMKNAVILYIVNVIIKNYNNPISIQTIAEKKNCPGSKSFWFLKNKNKLRLQKNHHFSLVMPKFRCIILPFRRHSPVDGPENAVTQWLTLTSPLLDVLTFLARAMMLFILCFYFLICISVHLFPEIPRLNALRVRGV